MKAYYSCYYDGNECEKAIPKFNDEGYLIPESNKEIKKKYSHIISEHTLEEGWDICDNCPRNFSMSGCCHGNLKMGE